MGLIFNGNGDVIKAVDGSLTVEGLDIGGSTNIEAGIGTFSNLNVTGVLTYEDVKNVDSVGIITARGGLNVTANTDTDTLNVSGISTFGGSLSIADKIIHTGDTDTAIRFPSSNQISFETTGSEGVRIDGGGRLLVGTTVARTFGGSVYAHLQLEGTTQQGSQLTITRNTNDTYSPNISLVKTRGTSDGAVTIVQDNDVLGTIQFRGADGSDVYAVAADINAEVDGSPSDGTDMPGALRFGTTAEGAASPTERLRINSSGHLSINGSNVTDVNYLTINGSGASNNVGIVLNKTNSPARAHGIQVNNTTGDLVFYDYTASAERLRITSDGNVQINQDSKFLQIGVGQDLDLHHNGTNSYIRNKTGNLHIRPLVNEEGIILKPNGAVELYHDNSLKVSTTASGARVHDQLQVDGTIFAAVGLKVNADNQKIRLGASDDLELFHNGSNTYISNSTGNLMITGNNSDKIHIRAHASKQEIVCFPSGAVQLFHNDSLRFETTSTGARIPDSKALELGDRNSGGVQGDLRLYHDGSNSYIDEIGSGNLYIRNNTDNAIFCQTDGNVKLYYDGSEKLSTTSTGVSVTGHVSASSNVYSDKLVSTTQSNGHSMYINARNAVGTEATLIKGTIGGAVELNYNTYNKLETNGEGINVTGRATFTGGTSAQTQSVYLSAGTSNPTQIGMYNGHGGKQGFCFYNNGSGSYTSWGMITDQQNWYLKTAAYNIGNTSDLSSNWTSRLEVSNSGVFTFNPGGRVYVRGGTTNGSQDTVMWIDKQNNNDWLIKLECGTGSSTDYACYVRANNSANYAFAVHNLSAWKFRVAGNGTIYSANTSVQSISDVRLKENIVDANSQWDDIKGLRFRNYNWKADSGHADGKTYLGLIAQEVETISPNLVEIDAQDKEDIENGVPDPEYKNVNYSIVWMKAVKALQEAQARIETLEAEVAALKSA